MQSLAEPTSAVASGTLRLAGSAAVRAPRQLIDESITPVWEANHVWLIFVLVIFWTGFPDELRGRYDGCRPAALVGFARNRLARGGFRLPQGGGDAEVAEALRCRLCFVLPDHAVLHGHRHRCRRGGKDRRLTPDRTSLSVWTQPISLLVGVLFVFVCAYLAAVYLITEASRRPDHLLEQYFTRRAEITGVVSGVLSLATLLEVRRSDLPLYNGLTGPAIAFLAVAGISGVIVLLLLITRRFRGLRVMSALGVAAVIWGWGVAQYPELLPGSRLTLNDGSAPHETLVSIVVVFVAAVILVGPAFLFLFSLQGRGMLKSESAVGH